MKTIAIYPGRFQPFGPHHFQAYQFLKKKFGQENVFIATSNKVGPKSPLNFNEKKYVISQYKIPEDKIVKVKNPYNPVEITENFDPNDTKLIVMLGDKDAGRLRPGSTKKDGTPSYYQIYDDDSNLPLNQHGYVIRAPHISINVGDHGEMSGTILRKFIAKATEEQFKEVFGWFKRDIYNMLKDKFQLSEAFSGLEKRLVELGLVKERKQLGTLYHFTSFRSLFYILSENFLKAGNPGFYVNSNVQSRFPKGWEKEFIISFTRDKNFHKEYREIGSDIQVKIEVDGDAISSNYKSAPHDDRITDEPVDDNHGIGYEAEEFIYGKRISRDRGIKPFIPYIKSITFLEDFLKKYGRIYQTHSYVEKFTNKFQKEWQEIRDDESNLIENYRPLFLKFANWLSEQYDISVNFEGNFLKENLNEGFITPLEDEIKQKWNADVELYDKGDRIELIKIWIPSEKRKLGIGGKVMDMIIKYADQQGKPIYLTPSTDWGGTSVNRLRNFYKRFGFVDNKGKHKDFSSKHLMLRLPEELNESKLISEGGGFGHMSHPFGEMDFTFNDLKELVERALTGELNLEGDVQEKMDGQNLMLTYKDGRVKSSRNKSTLKNPMTSDELADKFADRGAITTAFVEGMKDLETALQQIGDEKLNLIFKNGYRFLNVEILYPETRNVINYGDSPKLILLGMVEFNDNWKPVKNYPEEARKLGKFIEKANAKMQGTFQIDTPKPLSLSKSEDFSEKIPYFTNKIQKIIKESNLSWKNTLGDYYTFKFKQVVDSMFPDMDEELKQEITKRWGLHDKSFKMTKSVLGDHYEKFKTYEKTQLKQDFKKFQFPLEVIFLELGIEVMSNIQDFIATSPNQAVQDIRDEIANLLKQARNSDDPKIIRALQHNLRKIQAIGGFDKIIPAEGIVFNYKGKIMKLTGSFAPINQLLGIFRYQR